MVELALVFPLPIQVRVLSVRHFVLHTPFYDTLRPNETELLAESLFFFFSVTQLSYMYAALNQMRGRGPWEFINFSIRTIQQVVTHFPVGEKNSPDYIHLMIVVVATFHVAYHDPSKSMRIEALTAHPSSPGPRQRSDAGCCSAK